MSIPVFGFAGWSGSGKTTLIERLIPELKAKGLHLVVIKHDVHGLKTVNGKDCEGTDSWRFQMAGADLVILCHPGGLELEAALEEGKAFLRENSQGPGMILVEGFKYSSIPRIGLARREQQEGFTEPVETFIALVTDICQNLDDEGACESKETINNRLRSDASRVLISESGKRIPVFNYDNIDGLVEFLFTNAQRTISVI